MHQNMTTLIIAEKDKAAKAIASIFGPIKVLKKQNTSKIYFNPSKNIYVLPLRGHLLEYKNTEKYKSWSKTDPRNIIIDSEAIAKVPKSYAMPYINALKKYGKLSEEVIIATDADIEGCNIGLIDAYPFIKQANRNIKISQMWLSSLETNEIRNKISNVIPPKWNWAQIGEARAIIDAVIGFSATREVTNTLRPLLHKLNKKFVSIGRVQTSLLYLIYLRDEEINNFIPEIFWTIKADLINQNNVLTAYHDLNPFKMVSKLKAKTIYNKIKYEKFAHIIENTKSKFERKPPTPLNTSKALVLLTKRLKISAKVALNTMESLYLNKIISYPRTDSDVYKLEFNHKTYLQKFSSHSQYGNYTSNLFNEKRFRPTKGKIDAGDHPPITPLESIEYNSSKFESETQRKVYDILVRHYLALFGKNAEESKTTLKLLIKDEPFTSQSVILIFEGFLEIAPFLKRPYGSDIQIIGNEISIKEISINDKYTKPPPQYSDTNLLRLMERNRLGTKSTRPAIIEILIKRDLIYRSKRQYLITELGKFLIDNLKTIWLPFLKPEFTKLVEDLFKDIKDKKKTMDEVVITVKNIFLLLFDKFLANKPKIQLKIDVFKQQNSITLNKNYNNTFPSTSAYCPVCNKHPMKLVTPYKKRRFLVCLDENCKTYLSVPKNGRINILKSTCSSCGFNVFKIKIKKNNKLFNYNLCPKCWNDGLKDKNGKGFCSKCIEYKILNEECIKK